MIRLILFRRTAFPVRLLTDTPSRFIMEAVVIKRISKQSLRKRFPLKKTFLKSVSEVNISLLVREYFFNVYHLTFGVGTLTVSFLRPFRLRAASIFRPFFVDIRLRNPWQFNRLRFEG